MRTTIDRAGRVVIPISMRRATGLQPGSEIDLEVVGGKIEMELVPPKVRLERRGRFLVAVPEGHVEPITDETVRQMLEDMEMERAYPTSDVSA